MIVLTLIAIAGLVLVLSTGLVVTGRSASRRAEAKTLVEADVATKLRRAQELDGSFVQQVLAGMPVDDALTEYERSRSAILITERSGQTAAWTDDDVAAYKHRELRRQLEDIHRKLLLPGMGAVLAIVTLTVVTSLLYYHIGLADAGSTSTGVSPASPEFSTPLPLPSTVDPADPTNPFPPSVPPAGVTPPASESAADLTT